MNGWSPDVGPDLDVVVDRLQTCELTVEGRLPWSSNLTFLVALGGSDAAPDGTEPLRAVYKPSTGEQSLWDFPDGLYRREVAAYALSEALGWAIVPPTVERHDAPYGPGSLQLFVEADYNKHYFPLFDEGVHQVELRTFCAFDVVANNADRKSGHVLQGIGGRLWAIDHGLCFHRTKKLRTVIWDFADEEVPEGLVADLGRLRGELPDDLARLLSEPERDALLKRIRSLVDSGIFPEPTGEHPPYPWPLV